MGPGDVSDPRGNGPAPESEPDSRRPAVIGLIVVLLLVVAGYFLMTALRRNSDLEDCLMSGRRNCAPLDVPAPTR